MQSLEEADDVDGADAIPLSVRPAPRKRWSSAPPPPMPRRSSRPAMVVFGALWVVIGAASAVYVVQRAHDNVATTSAR